MEQMDGASKFVKGDATAGIIISLINIIGGFIVGVLQQGLTMQEALSKYTLLTVGDGLISQIPALLIATATGIIITRTSSDENMGTDMSHQLFSNPKVLGICSVVLLLFAFVPGLPVFPFLMMGSIIGAMSYSMNSFNKTKMIQQMEKTEASQEKVITPETSSRF